MENVRKHWKSLAAIAGGFVLLFLAGPLVVYGLPVLGVVLFDIHPLVLLLVIPALPLAWFIVASRIGTRADRRLDEQREMIEAFEDKAE